MKVLSPEGLRELLQHGARHVEMTAEQTLYVEELDYEGHIRFVGEFAADEELLARWSCGAPPGLVRFRATCGTFAHPARLAELEHNWERLRQAVLREPWP